MTAPLPKMTPEIMRERTKALALRVLKMVTTLGKDRISDVLARQITRSATSIAANYRAACRARTHTEFISKIGLVEEEADETVFWMEMIIDSGLATQERMNDIICEAKEILAIVTATRKTAKNGRTKL